MTYRETLVITGMHRSGTSLAASLLQNAGLFIGQNLLGEGPGNPKGHFENIDFLEFHRSVLCFQGLDDEGLTIRQNIAVDKRFIEQAKQIIAQCSNQMPWGWKDPRTTLFLDFWADLLPDAGYLLLYRPPWEVVDSLYRRNTDPVFFNQPDLAIKVWIHYCQKLLTFYQFAPENCFLVNVHTLARYQTAFIEALNSKLNFDLRLPEASPYEPDLLHFYSRDGYRALLLQRYFPRAIEVYKALEVVAWTPPDLLDSSYQPQPELPAAQYRILVLLDWLFNSSLETHTQKTYTELQQLYQQICEVEGVFAEIETQSAEFSLEVLKQCLEAPKQEMSIIKNQLHQTKVEMKCHLGQLDWCRDKYKFN